MALAAAQLGLLTHRQARSAGLSNDAILHKVHRGEWLRVRRGVYVVGGVPDSWERSVLAAVLACGPAAHASHTTAARLWGFGGFESDVIETTVPLERVVRLSGIRAHRSGTLVELDVAHAGPIPTVSAARTIVDLSSKFGDARLGELVDDGLRRRVLTLSALRAIAERLPTIAPGRSPRRVQRVLSARIAGYHPGDSELETRVLDVIVAAGLPEPIRQHRVAIGGRTYFLDFAYPDARIAIEVDGFDFHRARAVFDRDRVRQNDLVRAGWIVLRFTSESTVDEIVAAVRDLLFVR